MSFNEQKVAPGAAAPSVIIEGPLHKRTKWTRVWAKRYFELRGELLSYWKGSERPAAGEMCRNRHCTRDIKSVYENIDEKNSFHILLKDNDTDFILRAKDAETQKRWLDALRAAVAQSCASNLTSGAVAAVVPPPELVGTGATSAAAVLPPELPDVVGIEATPAPDSAFIPAYSPPSQVAPPPQYESIYPSMPSFTPAVIESEPVVAGQLVHVNASARVKPVCLHCGSTSLSVKPQCPDCLANGVFVLDTALPKIPEFKGEGGLSAWTGSGSCFACNQQNIRAAFVVHCHKCKSQCAPSAIL